MTDSSERGSLFAAQGSNPCTGASDCSAPTHIHGCFAESWPSQTMEGYVAIRGSLCADGVHTFREIAVCACTKQASAPQRAEGREGMLTVYDFTGQYVGCIGAELWQALVNAREASGV